MLSFPLSFVLIPYGLAVIFVLIFALIHVHYLVHYGATTRISYAATFAFFAGTVLIFFFTWYALKDVNWQQPVFLTLPFSAGSLPGY